MHSHVFEECQSVPNQQLPKFGDSLHKLTNSSLPDPIFPAPTQKENTAVTSQLKYTVVHETLFSAKAKIVIWQCEANV